MAMDHTNCTHPRTPAGRRACRKGGVTMVSTAPLTGVNIVYAQAQDRLMGKVQRRQRTEAALRIQPRRSGARVSAGNSACVQAALHTRGRCACGWENWDAVA
jgi:hypothetical protein